MKIVRFFCLFFGGISNRETEMVKNVEFNTITVKDWEVYFCVQNKENTNIIINCPIIIKQKNSIMQLKKIKIYFFGNIIFYIFVF
jgi:hypothetical protein